MTEPIWWREVLAATARRRQYTAELLAHATPTVERGRLRLEFPNADLVAAWHDSHAEAALEGALAHYGWSMPIEAVQQLPTFGALRGNE